MVDMLQCVTLTRPNIDFSVNKSCQITASPLESHWTSIKKIMWYLSGVVTHGLLLTLATLSHKFSQRPIVTMIGLVTLMIADLSLDLVTFFVRHLFREAQRNSLSFLDWALKQSIIALTHTTLESLWVGCLFNELVVIFRPPALLYDNLIVVLLSRYPMIHARTKYVELDIHFVRERVIVKRMKIQYSFSSVQVVDTLTKPLSSTAFQHLWTKIELMTFIPPWIYVGVLGE